jgi:hypothetical protein
MAKWLLFSFLSAVVISSCGVYSFSGASIQGKTLNMHTLENKAPNVVPSLSSNLTLKIRSRILSQSGLAPVNTETVDYDITGTITTYTISVSGVSSGTAVSQNRLTIGVEIKFKNRLDEKASFTQTFSRFADFPATQSLQAVETQLIEEIGNQLADDIFNKAFVNW